MKVILLPGLDGSGLLFKPLREELKEIDHEVIPLPTNCPQDYKTLANEITKQLPDNDILLIAESFSGPLAAQIATQQPSKIKGIVFVATFLSSPRPNLLRIFKQLPIKSLNKLPGARFIQQLFLFGGDADQDLLNLFGESLELLTPKVLKARLSSLLHMNIDFEKSTLPCKYIRANRDGLVPRSKINDFLNIYPNISASEIDGPHFILQIQARKTSALIKSFIQEL